MSQHIHQIFHSLRTRAEGRVPHRSGTECTTTVKENAPFKLPTKHCLTWVSPLLLQFESTQIFGLDNL